MSERKPIEAISVCDNPLIHKYCPEPEVRQLESDYSEALETIDLMIIDRDAYHDKNVEIEKKLKKMKCCGNCDQENLEFDCFITDIDIRQHNYICDNWKFKGDQNEM